jgi:hypothetical protein
LPPDPLARHSTIAVESQSSSMMHAPKLGRALQYWLQLVLE